MTIQTLGPNQLMECETLSISLSPETNNPSGGEISYFILALEPGGNATMSLVGHEPSSLQWTIQRPAGAIVIIPHYGSVLSDGSSRYSAFRRAFGLFRHILRGSPSHVHGNA